MGYANDTGLPPDLAYLVPQTPEYFIHQNRAGTTTRYVSYSMFTLLIWDLLLTFPREVDVIWPARWTVIKVLFLFNRYMSPAMITLGIAIMTGYLPHVTNKFCQSWLLANIGMEQLCLVLVMFVMVFRLHASWGASRSMFIFLLATWLAGVAVNITLWITILHRNRQYVYASGPYRVCFAIVPDMWQLFVSNSIQHAILLSILIVKTLITPRSSKAPMLRILLKDGIFFYSITFAVTLSIVLTWAFVERSWNGLPLYSSWSICTIATSRFLLSLKTSQLHPPPSNRRDLGFPITPLSTSPEPQQIELGENGAWKETVFVTRETTDPSSRDGTWKSNLASSDQSHVLTENILLKPPSEAGAQTPSILTKTSEKRNIFQRLLRSTTVVEVDCSNAEWWSHEDRGPGWQESELGRYDRWL